MTQGAERTGCADGIVGATTDSIVTFDGDGVIGFVNPAVRTMFGYGEDEVVGRNIHVLLPPAHSEEGLDAILGSGIGSEREGRRSDGTMFSVDVSVSAVDPPHLFAAVVRDISHRELFEQELARVAMAEQERIGRDLHDTVCQTLAALALLAERECRRPGEEASAEPMRELAGGIRDALVTLRSVARGLTVMATDAASLMIALEELASSVRRRHGVGCTVRADSRIRVGPTTANHLYRIAAEAVGNALRHARPREITIRLMRQGGRTVLRVRDDGTGMSAEAAGGGIGLWVMRHRARAVGAGLVLRSSATGGTVVSCTLKETHGKHRKRREAGSDRR